MKKGKNTKLDNDESGWASRAVLQSWENQLRKGKRQKMIGGLPHIKDADAPVVVIVEEYQP